LVLVPKTLFLVKQICPAAPKIYNLGTSLAVLFETSAFEAVKGVGYAFAAADDALVDIVPKGALVADAYEGGRSHIGIADGALAVAFVAEAAD